MQDDVDVSKHVEVLTNITDTYIYTVYTHTHTHTHCAFVGMNNKKSYKVQRTYIKNWKADLFHLVSVLRLINFDVDNSVYTIIPSSSYMFFFCHHY
jgi:hypothetical protein